MAQVEVTDVAGPYFREFTRTDVNINVGGFQQICAGCMGGYILSAGAYSFQDGSPGRDYENSTFLTYSLQTLVPR